MDTNTKQNSNSSSLTKALLIIGILNILLLMSLIGLVGYKIISDSKKSSQNNVQVVYQNSTEQKETFSESSNQYQEKTEADNTAIAEEMENMRNVMQSAVESLKEQLAKQEEQNRKREEENRRKEKEAESAMKELRDKQEQERIAWEKEQAEIKKKEEEKARAHAEILKAVNSEIANGQTALNKSDIPGAIGHFDKAKSLIPDEYKDMQSNKLSEISSTLQEASQNLEGDKKEEALKAAKNYSDEAKEASKDGNFSSFTLAMQFMEAKDYPNAEKSLILAVEEEPDNALIHYQLGRALALQSKSGLAEEEFIKSINCDDLYPQARYNLGVMKERLKKTDEAIESYRKAYELDGNYEKAHLAAARIYLKKKDYDNAIKEYQEAIKVRPNKVQNYQELGSCFSNAKKYQEAEENYKKALSLMEKGKEDPVTYYNLSAVLLQQTKVDEALENAKLAYERKDGSAKNIRVNISYNYALLSDLVGNKDEAIRLYEEVLSEDTTNVKAITNLGALYLEKGESDKSIALLEKAYEGNKRNFELNNNLGNAHRAKEEYEKAISFYKTALEIQPGNASVLFNLAKSYAGAKKYEEAGKTIATLQEKFPDFHTEELNLLLETMHGL